MIVIAMRALFRHTCTVAVVLGLLAGCGQPGPLYLPKPPAKPAPAAPSAAASASASVQS